MMVDDIRQPPLTAPGPPDDPFLQRASVPAEPRWKQRARAAVLNVAGAALAVATMSWILLSPDAQEERAFLRRVLRVFGAAAPVVAKWIVWLILIIWVSACVARLVESTTDELAEKIAKAIAKELRERR